jgi:hypothetical protein
MCLSVLIGRDGGDGTGDGGGRDGDRNTYRHLAGNVLYIVQNFHVNPGDVQYARSLDRDGYVAGCAPGWGWR